MEFKNTFVKGKMNKDLDERLLPKGEYRHAENIRVVNSEGSEIGAIENSLGNKKLVSYSFGSNAKTIGAVSDSFDNTIYWWVLSDTGSFLMEYNVDESIYSLVLHDSRASGSNVLNLNASYLITGANIIIDSDNGDKFIAWTDNYNPPRMINIARAKTYAENGFSDSDISLVKAPPLYTPTVVLSDTPTDNENNIEEKFIRFSYRYQYLDGEYSALSPFSEIAFAPSSFKYDFSTGTNESMVNKFNQVTISFNTGSSLVKSIDVVFKESGSNAVYLIESLDKSAESWLDNTTESLVFNNNKLYKVLPQRQLFRLFDAVPLKAKSQEIIGNRLIFGNYTENYDLIDSDGNTVNIDFTLNHTTSPIVSGTPAESNKSNRDMEVVIAYLDEYGRMTTGLSSLNNSVHIPISDSINKNNLEVTVAHKAPSFAKHYRFFIKQNKTDYETISPIIFYTDGVYRWIKLENSDINKVKEGDYLIVKSDSSQILQTLVKTKVLEVSQKNVNFLQPEDVVDKIIEKSGVYFKIKPDGFRLNADDFENFDFSTYHNARRQYHDALNTGTSDVFPASYYGDTLNDMTSGGTCTLGAMVDARYIVNIDSLPTPATATVTLNSGASGSVDGITVNGVQIMSGAEAFDTDLDTTATNVASNITAFTSTPNYSAVAVGSVITITSIDTGTTINGFVVTTSATTITTTDVNMSGATDDTFRWSDDNGNSFTNGVAITGAAQTLSNGIQVTFGASTGHSLLDSWEFYARGAIVSDNSRSYAWYRMNGAIGETLTSSGLTLDDEIIENGAVIDLEYDEWNRGDVNWTISNVSGAQYDNIIEWYYKENIGNEIVTQFPTFDLTSITFQRCVVYNAVNGNAQYSVKDNDGFMTMVIKSQNAQSSSEWVYSRASTTLFQSDGDTRLIFETDPKNENSDIFYEIGRTYDIDSNGNHLGFDIGDTNQNVGVTNALLKLPTYNCFSWGNAFESYKIKDEFNANSFKIDTRPTSTIEDYKKNVRIASLTYGEKFEQSTNYNGINEFNLSESNFKDLDDKYNSIQKLYTEDTNLIVFQEDKVHKILFNKDVLYNADGSGNVRQTNTVLGQEVPYVGEYGISTNPESFAVDGRRKYFTDSRRGSILRLSNDGLFEISNNGMTDWFRDNFRQYTNTKKIGEYDVYTDQYVIHLDDIDLYESIVIPCGTTINSFELEGNKTFTYDLGDVPSSILLSYTVTGSVDLIIRDDSGTLNTINNITNTSSTQNVTRVDTNSNLYIDVIIQSLKPSITLNVPCPI